MAWSDNRNENFRTRIRVSPPDGGLKELSELQEAGSSEVPPEVLREKYIS
jgi:hypothetical protein